MSETTYMKPILPDLEPSPRWLRVQFNDLFVADSKRVLLARDGSRLTYYFPEEDVRLEHLSLARLTADGRQLYNLSVDDRTAEGAAWVHQATEKPALQGYMAFSWLKMDHWFEEEEEVFVHPRDPYHRIDAMRSSRHVQVQLDGLVVADSTRPVLVFETEMPVRYYLPRQDVRMELLEETNARTTCPYKGFAGYFNLVIDGKRYRNLAWSYVAPFKDGEKVEGLICFPSEQTDIWVDGQALPRP